MAAIDAITLIIITLSTLHGLWRGFTRQALGLISWIVAIMLALRFHNLLTPWVGQFIHAAWGVQLAALALVLLGALVVGYLLAALVVCAWCAPHRWTGWTVCWGACLGWRGGPVWWCSCS
ncbi:MAG: CvpA family protein [Acetobacter syzygii]|uniref:CvpA family protein n=1 Tax=Acetobacter syzygii TaxID=146476 RepID=UPI0039ED437E